MSSGTKVTYDDIFDKSASLTVGALLCLTDLNKEIVSVDDRTMRAKDVYSHNVDALTVERWGVSSSSDESCIWIETKEFNLKALNRRCSPDSIDSARFIMSNLGSLDKMTKKALLEDIRAERAAFSEHQMLRSSENGCAARAWDDLADALSLDSVQCALDQIRT